MRSKVPVNSLADPPDGVGDRRLVALQQFTAGRVQLVSVAVERDVAAGHHNAAFAAAQRVIRDSRCGNCAEIDGTHSGVAHRLRDCLADFAASRFSLDEAGGTGAQVVTKIELVAVDDSTLVGRERLQVLQFGKRVDVDLQLGEMGDFPPATAGSEFQLLRRVGEVRSEAAHCRCSRSLAAANIFPFAQRRVQSNSCGNSGSRCGETQARRAAGRWPAAPRADELYPSSETVGASEMSVPHTLDAANAV